MAASLTALLSGCATDLLTIQGEGRGAVYLHRELGYSIAAPDRREAGLWLRQKVEGATLAFRESDSAGGSTMSMLTRCGGPEAPPMILSRHLTIGLRDREIRQSLPVTVDGVGGWLQVFDTRLGEMPVRVKTVTVRTLGCTFDWVLVSRGAFSRYEAGFDSWWGSFHRGGAGESPTSGETVVVAPGAPGEERSEGPAEPEPAEERAVE